MSVDVVCDNCGERTNYPGGLGDPVVGWYTVSAAAIRDLHFHSILCLREWFSLEAVERLDERADPFGRIQTP